MIKAVTDNRGTRFLMTAAALVIVVAGLRAIKPIALPFIVATLLSLASVPLLNALQRRRVPTFLAVATTVLANVAFLIAILLLVGGSIKAFTESVPAYQQRFERRAGSALDWVESKGIDISELSWLQERGRSDPPPGDTPGSESSGNPPEPGDGASGEEPSANLIAVGSLVDFVGSTLRNIAELFTMALLIFLMMVFILLETAGLPHKLEHALGWTREDLSRMTEAKREIQHYLFIKSLVSLATGLILGLWVWAMGVEFPVLWGLLAFLLNFIPNLGSVLASIPAVLLAWIETGPGTALVVALGYIAVNLILGNFIEPHLMGRQLGMSTLIIFLSLVFWGWVWGPIGMLLSVPLTMILKITLEHTEEFCWVAQLISAKPTSMARRAPSPRGS